MEPAFRTEITVSEEGTLHLEDLPFRRGERLEVILIPRTAPARARSESPLRGSVLRFDDPTAPVADEEWEALR